MPGYGRLPSTSLPTYLPRETVVLCQAMRGEERVYACMLASDDLLDSYIPNIVYPQVVQRRYMGR